jgi:hypothetical protein
MRQAHRNEWPAIGSRLKFLPVSRSESGSRADKLTTVARRESENNGFSRVLTKEMNRPVTKENLRSIWMVGKEWRFIVIMIPSILGRGVYNRRI